MEVVQLGQCQLVRPVVQALRQAQLAEQVAERRTLEREFTEAHRAYHAAK